MAIRVVGGIAGASISAVKLRAGVAAVHPTTSVTYSAPIAQTAYILLSTVAQLDTTGRFKYQTDLIVMNDGTALHLVKGAQDAIALTDYTTLGVDKGLAESVAFSDAIVTVLIFLRDFADSLALSDAQALTVAKAFVDAASATDAATLAFASNQADAVSLVEATALSLAKSFADSVGATDDVALAVDRAVADAATLADAAVLLVSKAIDETQQVLDDVALSSAKALTDGVGLNESLAFDYALASTIGNVAFVSDLAVVSSNKPQADSVGTTDSGFILSQDYCDLTYFAEDYVGTAKAF